MASFSIGGEVAERLNAAVLKTAEGNLRGFESHPLRQPRLRTERRLGTTGEARVDRLDTSSDSQVDSHAVGRPCSSGRGDRARQATERRGRSALRLTFPA